LTESLPNDKRRQQIHVHVEVTHNLIHCTSFSGFRSLAATRLYLVTTNPGNTSPTMAGKSATFNKLVSSKPSDSPLAVQLHPLVLLTVSDYITRHTLREQNLRSAEWTQLHTRARLRVQALGQQRRTTRQRMVSEAPGTVPRSTQGACARSCRHVHVELCSRSTARSLARPEPRTVSCWE
jgi:hypothetical protein